MKTLAYEARGPMKDVKFVGGRVCVAGDFLAYLPKSYSGLVKQDNRSDINNRCADPGEFIEQLTEKVDPDIDC